MAAAFVGCAILITLQNPPNAQVQGVVAHVDQASHTLFLRNGKNLVPSR